MMKNFYEYIGDKLVGKRFHVICDCFVALNIKGICTGYEINKGELILLIETKGKIIQVGANTPNLKIEEID